MTDKQHFAKYEEGQSGIITKDGHTMFSQDIVADLNRKSFLEKENSALKQNLGLLEISYGHKRTLLKSCEIALEERDEKNAKLTRDLTETQNQYREAENKLEDIELFFCDEDGCPIIEPLNSDGLESWIEAHNLEQQAKGVNDVALEINGIHVKEQNLGKLGKNQFYWWCLIFGHMTDTRKDLRNQAKKLRSE
ncbi:hypothetical protein [Paraglaciecola sp.]|uniref:hypothetical protein n=1 Tax=Paraglaciecola sp. TaxID=1920173 RepID=UPI003EF96263